MMNAFALYAMKVKQTKQKTNKQSKNNKSQLISTFLHEFPRTKVKLKIT